MTKEWKVKWKMLWQWKRFGRQSASSRRTLVGLPRLKNPRPLFAVCQQLRLIQRSSLHGGVSLTMIVCPQLLYSPECSKTNAKFFV